MDTDWETVTESSEDSQHVDDPDIQCPPDWLPSDNVAVSAHNSKQEDGKAAAPSENEGSNTVTVYPWPSRNTEWVYHWLSTGHGGASLGGPATLLLSVELHRCPGDWRRGMLTARHFCGSSPRCDLEHEPAAKTFGILASLVRDLTRPRKRDYRGTSLESSKEAAAIRVTRFNALDDYLVERYIEPAWSEMATRDKELWDGAFTYGYPESLKEASIQLSRALAQGVCNIYHDTLEKRGFNTTDESGLVRFGSVSFDDLKKLESVLSRRCPVPTFKVARPTRNGTGSVSLFIDDLEEGSTPPDPSTESKKPSRQKKMKPHAQGTKWVIANGPDGKKRTEAR